MQTILIIVGIGLIGGVAVGLQGPLASMLSQSMGPLESIFIVHLGGAIASLFPLVLLGGGKLADWRNVPWYTLGAGIFGLVVIGAMSYLIPRVGVAPSIMLIVAGQLAVSVLLDHYGLLGAPVRHLDLKRLFGLLVVFAGVWLTVR